MNSQQETNKYFRSKNNKLPLKDYLILVALLIPYFLVGLFGPGLEDVGDLLKSDLISVSIISIGIIVSIFITIYILKKLDY